MSRSDRSDQQPVYRYAVTFGRRPTEGILTARDSAPALPSESWIDPAILDRALSALPRLDEGDAIGGLVRGAALVDRVAATLLPVDPSVDEHLDRVHATVAPKGRKPITKRR